MIEHLYQDLKRLAAHYMASERPNHTLAPTALVNEAYRRLMGNATLQAKDRHHFFALAGRTMRRVLVDHGRRRKASPQGYRAPEAELEQIFCFDSQRPGRFLAVDQALIRLAAHDERMCSIVEMRFFAGLSEDEIAEALGLSRRTVIRDWKVAKAWLQEAMG